MRPRAAIIIAMFLAFAGTATAQPPQQDACRLITQLDQLQVVQTRLAQGTQIAFHADDIRFLRSQIGQIDPDAILGAVGETRQSTAGRALVGLLNQTADLLGNPSLGNAETTRAHFRQPAVLANLRLIRGQMRQWRCPIEGIITMDPWTAQRDGTSTTEFSPSDPFETPLNATIYLILLATLIASFIGAKLYKIRAIRNRRQAKRYRANFSTLYRRDDKEFRGVLIDISGKGAKLRLDLRDPRHDTTQIEVLIFDDWISGTVAWKNEHYNGVLFRNPLSDTTVNAIRKGLGIWATKYEKTAPQRDAVSIQPE